MKCDDYSCPNRNEMGYCKLTACTNPNRFARVQYTDRTENYTYVDIQRFKNELKRRLKMLENYNNTPIPQWVMDVIEGMD